MFVYIGIYLVFAAFALSWLTPQQRKPVLILTYIFLVVFVGTRFETGCDFSAYVSRFSRISSLGNLNISGVVNTTEPGYYVFTYIIKKLGFGFVWVNFIGAVIFFFYLYRFIRNHPTPFLVLTIMFPLLVIQLSMSGIRQALAVAFLMAAFDAFIKNKRLFVMLYIAIGASFHTSAIILLPLAFMVGRNFSFWRVAAALTALTPVALVLLSDRLGVYQDRYIDEIYGDMTSYGGVFRVGLIVLSAIAFEIYRDGVSKYFPKEYNLMRMFSLASFVLIPILLVNTVMAHRLAYYIAPIQMYTLCAIPFAYCNADRARFQAARLAIVGVYAAYILVWFATSRHASICYLPYDSYLL